MNKPTIHLRLLFDLTRREFKVRYLGSMLGAYWNLIHPLMMIGIYTVVFSQVMRARLGDQSDRFSYSLYLCSGLLAWNFLSEVVNRSAVTILDNAAFMKKLAFPPVILFGASLASAFVNFMIAFLIFLAILLYIRPLPLPMLGAYMGIIILLGLFALGLGVGLGCLNVFMRDVQQLTGVIFQLWFWFTPIVYLTDALPAVAKSLLPFNPAFAFIEPLHQLMYFHQWPEPRFWWLMAVWLGLSALFGTFIYRKSITFVRDQL